MRKLTQKITEIVVCRGWIPEEQHEWGSYTIMKYLETIIFFCFVFVISCLFGRWLEMFFTTGSTNWYYYKYSERSNSYMYYNSAFVWFA